MTRGIELELIRLLAGELDPAEARDLEARIRREPELAAAYQRLERTWRGLELPPPAPVPPGFAGRVMARARNQSAQGSLSWSSAPGWVRATAAAALVAGAALGIGVGRSLPVLESHSSTSASVSSPNEEEDYSLAGSYWSLVEDATDGKEAQP